METKRRQQLLLVALAVVLGVVMYRAFITPSAVQLPASNTRAGTGAAARPRAPATPTAPDVHLDALASDRPQPAPGARDLFRFKPKAPPPAPAPVVPTPSAGTAVAPPVPTGPPPPPPIPYKFIGLVEAQGQAKRIAVLSDGRGGPVYGREGDIIEGRYRIVRIGAESIEMEHIDGRGRQTIRLSGS